MTGFWINGGLFAVVALLWSFACFVAGVLWVIAKDERERREATRQRIYPARDSLDDANVRVIRTKPGVFDFDEGEDV